ncbi:unnamed protein product [Microthlaspi erraticum]|uniref:FKB95-like N-terminal Kelch domain-containing protein n=1 Tax=Microthlaspi erraticum TaxID=1685480 RepID=A0A6D2I3E4_9BRAS|nr:unnamed protein product [Microthlaspi erraticum]
MFIGSEIYIIGGPSKEPSSSVRILDCRKDTWRDGPSMTVARKNARALFCDGKIYVMGGCDIDKYSASWFEVFDMKTQSWTALPGPGADEDELLNLFRAGDKRYRIENVFEGKIFIVVDEKEYAHDPKDGTWKFVRQQSSFRFFSLAVWCEINNIMYCCTWSGVLMWSKSCADNEAREWREIKGLGELCENRLVTASEFDMIDYGEKLLVMWKSSGDKQKNTIWYAKISLESRSSGREVWGKVECVDELMFPVESFESIYCLTLAV